MYMKSLKTAIILISIILLISVLIYFLPIENIFARLPLINTFYTNTTLEIVTPNGKSDIFIDGKEYGQTPNNIYNLVEGKYTVTLKRSEDESFYKPQNFDINLTKNTTSRINIEIGPDSNISGTVLYYTSNILSNKGKISITSNADNSKVYLNDEYLNLTPITDLDLNEGEYNIDITANGYETVSTPIIVRNGHVINIKAYLLPIPITYNE